MIDPRIEAGFLASSGFSLERHCILFAKIGSHSHGTYLPPTDPMATDDVDFMGVVIPPKERLLGLSEWEHWHWQSEELDVVVYSLRKAVSLLLKGNPNIMGLLWLRPEFYERVTTAGQSLIDFRQFFSSLDAYPSFIGYAHGQLKRMTAFDEDRMREYEYLSTLLKDAGLDIPDVLSADVDKLKHLATVSKIEHATLQKFRQLHKNYFSGYMGEKRKGIVRQHGYDTKNASHLIRLLRMGVEFLNTAQLNVYRDDAKELQEIKLGQWTLEQVQAEAERLFAAAEIAKRSSPLLPHPNRETAESLLVQMHLDSLK